MGPAIHSERSEQAPHSPFHNTMDVSSWSTTFFVVVVAIAGVAIYLCFLSCGDDDERRNSSRSTLLPTSRTRVLHPSTQPDPYSRGQTSDRPPAAYNDHHHFYHSSRSPTHTGDAGRASSTSAHANPPYPQSPNPTSFIQPVAKTQESAAAQDNGHHAYRARGTPSYVGESREALKPAPTPASRPAPLSSIRVDQNKTRTTLMAGYGNNLHRTDLASHYVGESSQIPTTSNRAQASYHQLPTRSHVTEATAKTKANTTTTDHEGYGFRPRVAAPYASESRATFETSACTDVSHPPPQLISLHVSTTATADITYDAHRPRLAPPYSQAEESPLTGPVSSCIPTPPYRHTHSSSSERLDTTSSSRVVPRSPSPVPDTQYGVEVEAVADAQELKAARELRERARRCKREMHAARDLAKSSRKSGDYKAEQRHKHDAMAYESQMKDMDKRAARIIFRENNKVLGYPSRY